MTEKILVVDDEVDTLRLVGLTLQRQGVQIIAAGSGTQVLEMVEPETPDRMILDVLMPDLDGYEVAGQAEEMKVPFIMLQPEGLAALHYLQ